MGLKCVIFPMMVHGLTLLSPVILLKTGALKVTGKQISGGGTGSGFYNVSVQHPLIEGYYTIETALQAIANDKIDDEDKKGKIITFEVSAGKWEDYRFQEPALKLA